MSTAYIAALGLVALFVAVALEALRELRLLSLDYRGTPRQRLIAIITGLAGLAASVGAGLELGYALRMLP